MEQAQTLNYPKSIPEDNHWWFATRTLAIEKFLDAMPNKQNLDVLDVGCGAGNMIHHLAQYGRVRGIEVDARPVKIAQQRGYDVRQGDATQTIPFPGCGSIPATQPEAALPYRALSGRCAHPQSPVREAHVRPASPSHPRTTPGR